MLGGSAAHARIGYDVEVGCTMLVHCVNAPSIQWYTILMHCVMHIGICHKHVSLTSFGKLVKIATQG